MSAADTRGGGCKGCLWLRTWQGAGEKVWIRAFSCLGVLAQLQVIGSAWLQLAGNRQGVRSNFHRRRKVMNRGVLRWHYPSRLTVKEEWKKIR
ncbi:hypothetical protein NE237_000043 [Protea cynaroides]|uniref:Uncharacterized protein n=1 Tax=Protea cynaroides TaxID=273540 RepID=A0A9Q0JS40_9MAGN|nr:hypothetical protein NE237_000043 [Protea cynaroides]